MRQLTAACLLVLLGSPALAQSVELAPVFGYRFGGSFAFGYTGGGGPDDRGLELADAAALGAHLGIRLSEDAELDLLYARQGTELRTARPFAGQGVFDLALESWQLGGNYLFRDDEESLRPYIGFALGVTRLLPEPAGLQDETRFSASFAGGLKVWLAKNVGLRVEARGFFTFLESDEPRFCGTPDHCPIESRESDISQAEIRGGLVLRF